MCSSKLALVRYEALSVCRKLNMYTLITVWIATMTMPMIFISKIKLRTDSRFYIPDNQSFVVL